MKIGAVSSQISSQTAKIDRVKPNLHVNIGLASGREQRIRKPAKMMSPDPHNKHNHREAYVEESLPNSVFNPQSEHQVQKTRGRKPSDQTIQQRLLEASLKHQHLRKREEKLDRKAKDDFFESEPSKKVDEQEEIKKEIESLKVKCDSEQEKLRICEFVQNVPEVAN